jgi:hypothetical protein
MTENLKLGKKRGVVQDPRTFQFSRLLDPTGRPTPPLESRYARDLTWAMLANDRYGCCTCAASGHQIELQERNAGQREVQVSDHDVLEAYSAVTGFDPARPETDNGAYCLDVLNYRRRVGIGREKDGSRHTIYAFAKVNHKADAEVKLASWMFGGVYIGVALPESAQREPYDWHTVLGPNVEPGSWGGHCVTVNGYDHAYVYFVTWGRQARMSWAFWAKYVDEAYAVISEDFLNQQDRTRTGFRRDELESWLKTVG